MLDIETVHSGAILDLGPFFPCRYEITLYAHISSIMWEYEEKERVKGHISKPQEGDIRNFDFDPKQISQFELTNQLWEMIG
jgi:hypothetical protein